VLTVADLPSYDLSCCGCSAARRRLDAALADASSQRDRNSLLVAFLETDRFSCSKLGERCDPNDPAADGAAEFAAGL
jgi:hypothetical protein